MSSGSFDGNAAIRNNAIAWQTRAPCNEGNRFSVGPNITMSTEQLQARELRFAECGLKGVMIGPRPVVVNLFNLADR